MLATADRQQGFFDAAWCAELVPEDSIYALLAEHGERIVRDEDFADCYSERHGRPSIPPSLLLHGKERLVFERSLQLATELGLFSGPAEQILDSTPMLGAAAVQDTATLVRSGVRKLIDAVKAAEPEAADGLASGLRFDYRRPRESR